MTLAISLQELTGVRVTTPVKYEGLHCTILANLLMQWHIVVRQSIHPSVHHMLKTVFSAMARVIKIKFYYVAIHENNVLEAFETQRVHVDLG